jgi:hypothetical protein
MSHHSGPRAATDCQSFVSRRRVADENLQKMVARDRIELSTLRFSVIDWPNPLNTLNRADNCFRGNTSNFAILPLPSVFTELRRGVTPV